MNGPFPTDLGGCIDALYNLRVERLSAEKVVKGMKSQELALSVRIKELLDAISLEAGSGRLATGSVIHSVEPTAKDWPAIYKFITENDAFDMLQRRLSPLAVKERWDEGIIVPGIEKFDTWDLSLTKRSK